MKIQKLFFVTVLAIIGWQNTWAQTALPYQDYSKNPRTYAKRNSFWFEGNFNGTIAKNDSGQVIWQYQLDYQYRRFADASYIKDGNTVNIFKDMYQNVLRPWIHYYVVPGKFRLSLSPLGYWSTWSPGSEGPVTYTPEYRTSIQATLFQKLGRFEFQQRYRMELRWLANAKPGVAGKDFIYSDYFFPETGYKQRLRYMLRTNYYFKPDKSSYLTVWDELFIGLGKNTPNTKIFDQNRLVVMYGHKVSKAYPIKIEVGLTWQLQPKYNFNVPPTQPVEYGSYAKNNRESNLALQVYLIFDDFHKFKKKKE